MKKDNKVITFLTPMELWKLYEGRDYDIKPTLDRIASAVRYVGNPQRSYPAFLVGGTNGKGSTCAFLERLLREHGYKTGWFVSPHLVRENERWRIDGVPIKDETLSLYIQELKQVFQRFELTYFESATLIALCYFRDMGVDVAVMEVGMGGRWDATKVSDAVCVCITNVERDHTRWLGTNIELIAHDKLHLYRKGIPLVLGSARFPLYSVALEMGIEDLTVAGEDFSYSSSLEEGRTHLKDYMFGGFALESAKLGLLGKWQADNASLALTMASTHITLDNQKVKKALSETRWEGRMEIVRESPLLILDGSHNPYGVAKVVKEVKRLFPKIEFLFTGLIGKEWQLSMEIIRRFTDSIYLVQVSYYRGEPIANLREYAQRLGFKEINILDSPPDVWKLEVDICAIGSLYLIGEIKSSCANTVI